MRDTEALRECIYRVSQLQIAEQIAVMYVKESRLLRSSGKLSIKEYDARITDARLAFLAVRGEVALIRLTNPEFPQWADYTAAPRIFNGDFYDI